MHKIRNKSNDDESWITHDVRGEMHRVRFTVDGITHVGIGHTLLEACEECMRNWKKHEETKT